MASNDASSQVEVRIEPWGEGGLPLLVMLNDPEMTKYVGGPESPEKLAERQSRFEKADSGQYTVVIDWRLDLFAESRT